MSGYRCASTQAILELFEYNAAIQTPARLMIDAINSYDYLEMSKSTVLNTTEQGARLYIHTAWNQNSLARKSVEKSDI